MSVLDAPVLDDIQDKPVQGAEFQKLFVIHLVRRADVKLVIVQEVPKRIILYVQKSTEFPGQNSQKSSLGSAEIPQLNAKKEARPCQKPVLTVLTSNFTYVTTGCRRCGAIRQQNHFNRGKSSAFKPLQEQMVPDLFPDPHRHLKED